jgi:glycosyl transferase family 25
LNKIGLDFFRVDAVKYDPGYIGCSMSHIKCLEKAIEENAKHIMIVEDDFKFIIDRTEFEDIIKYLLNIDYDVFILSYNAYDENIKRENGSRFYKIKNTQTASGYIVNSRYYEKLLKNFREGVELLKKTNIYDKYAIDQYWKILQTEDNWICAGKRIGIQRPSYSDIEKRDVNYNV